MGIEIPQVEQQVFPSGPAAPYQQIDPSPIGAAASSRVRGLGVLSQGLSSAADVLAQHAVQFQQTDNETYAKQADATFLEQAGKVEGEYYATSGQTAMEGYGAFSAKMQALRESALSSLPNAAAKRLLDGVLAPRIGSALASGSRHAAEQRVTWQGQTSEARAQAAIDDAAFRYTDPVAALKSMAILRGEAKAQGALKGWSPEMTADREKQYVSAMWKARLLRQSESDPEGALAIFKAHSEELDAQTQVELGHSLEADWDRQMNRTLALQEHADRKAEKVQKQQGDDMSRYGYTLYNQGALTREFIEGATPFLEPAEVKGFYELLQKDPNTPTVDDPQALASLEDSLTAGEDIGQQAFQYLQNNEITGSTYTSYMGKARTLRADDQPASPYKQGRNLVQTSLDPGLISGGDATTAALMRGAQASAMLEFDNWFQANGKAAPADVLAEAMDTVKRYQIINSGKIAITLGLPRFYGGTREALTTGGPEAAAQLDAAGKAVLDALAAGGMTRPQADQELRKINDWRYIVAHPAGATGTTQ